MSEGVVRVCLPCAAYLVSAISEALVGLANQEELEVRVSLDGEALKFELLTVDPADGL